MSGLTVWATIKKYSEAWPLVLIFLIVLSTISQKIFPNEALIALVYFEKFTRTSLNFFINTHYLETLTLVLLGITIPIFVLTVTLLGRAGKTAQLLTAENEKEKQRAFEEDLLRLQQIQPKPDEMSVLEKQIRGLRSKILESDRTKKKISRRYGALALTDAVLMPAGALAISLLFQNALSQTLNFVAATVYLILALAFFIYGISKIIFTLVVVQEVSINMDADRMGELRTVIEEISKKNDKSEPISVELRSALADALRVIEEQREPKPTLKFLKPLIFKAGSETEVEFRVNLADDGNKEAQNAEVMILTSPEIELLADSHYELFKQRGTYDIPNANSLIYRFSKIRKHSYHVGKVRVRTNSAGAYRLRYKVNCDGHVEATKELQVVVEN